MHLIVTVLLAISLATACTTRVVHEPPAVVTLPDALNINTANGVELERLPGIGIKTAERIVAYRIENGPFRRVEHLMLIRGMSEQRFAELRPMLRVE